MTAMTTADFYLDLGKGNVQFVMHHDDMFWIDFIKTCRCPDRATGLIHDRFQASSARTLTPVYLCLRTSGPENLVRQSPKEWRRTIVSSAINPMLCRFLAYFPPGLPRPTNKIIRRYLTLQQRLLRLLHRLRSSTAAFSPEDGAAIEQIVKSRSVIVGSTPSGNVIAEMWIESPTDCTGKVNFDTFRNCVCRNVTFDSHDEQRSRTPPRFRPSEAPSFT